MTITDKNGDILQPTDTIELKTKAGNKQLKITAIKGKTIKAKFLSENKTVSLDAKKHRNIITLYNIDDAFAKSDNAIFPFVSDILSETKTASDDSFRTNSPVISLQEMTNFGIGVKGHMTDAESLEYNKVKISRLLKEAKTLTRDFPELKTTTTNLNTIISNLK